MGDGWFGESSLVGKIAFFNVIGIFFGSCVIPSLCCSNTCLFVCLFSWSSQRSSSFLSLLLLLLFPSCFFLLIINNVIRRPYYLCDGHS